MSSGLIGQRYKSSATTPLGKQQQPAKSRTVAPDSDTENLISAGDIDNAFSDTLKKGASRSKGAFSTIMADSESDDDMGRTNGTHDMADIGVEDDEDDEDTRAVKEITDASKVASPALSHAKADAAPSKKPVKGRASTAAASSGTKRKKAEPVSKAPIAVAASAEEPPAKSKKKEETGKTYIEMMEYLQNHNCSEPNRSYIARTFANLLSRRFLDVPATPNE